MTTPESPSHGTDFDIYYGEFVSLLRQLQQEPEEAQSKRSPKDTESLHKQCSELLSLMSLEARSTADADTKFERLERTKIYKFQLEAVRQQHNQEFLMGDQAKSMLEVKDRLARTEMRAAQQNELLERARRSVLETEQVGASIMQEMHRNRETIESSQQRVGALSSMTEKASGIIKNMSKPWWRRRYRN